MVEVFRTNVTEVSDASRILDALHTRCTLYIANFDLDDRDRILRVKPLVGDVDATLVIDTLRRQGFEAEVLSDEISLLSGRLNTPV